MAPSDDGRPVFPALVTQTGCTMRVVPAGAPEDYALRGTRLLVLSMDQPGDGRTVEVRLTPNERQWLADKLTEGWI